MVLLHSAWSFNGLAGLLSLFTLLIVLSGFVGRYIYTSVPRTSAGVELSLEELHEQVVRLEKELDALQGDLSQGALPEATLATSGPSPVFGRAWYELQSSLNDWFARRKLPEAARPKARRLAELRQQRDKVRRQIQSLSSVRRLLAIWHAVHIPLGLTLFGMAFFHIAAAIYYALLSH
jgi:hypothetical protein